ncbi:MAG: DUF2933 domain-containing protein [Burkholderiales bacterium]
MQCNLKSMLSLTAAILAVMATAYGVFPQSQTLILANVPILLALICPVTMIAMMLAMRAHGANAPKTPPTVETQISAQRRPRS